MVFEKHILKTIHIQYDFEMSFYSILNINTLGQRGGSFDIFSRVSSAAASW